MKRTIRIESTGLRRLALTGGLAALFCLVTGACGPKASNGGGDGGSGLDGNLVDGSQTGDAFVLSDGGGSDALVGCDPKNFVLQQSPPAEVYLVIDRSGSMNAPGATPGLTKWEELNAAVDLALSQYAGAIRFGLLMYPSGEECNTSGPQVGIALNNGHAVLNHLTAAVPAGGTPTAAALNNAASALVNLGSVESPKFVVLATDGGPNCNYMLNADPQCSCSLATPEYCCTSHPGTCYFGNTCLDDQGTLDVIDSLYSSDNIGVFVIGLAGTSEYEGLLNTMAVAGGHPQLGGTSDYYPAENQAELLMALQSIAVGLISCEIVLEEPPDMPDLVRIYFDGIEVPRDTSRSNGWDYTDASNTVIAFFGDACDTLQDGDEHVLTATFACVVE